MTTERDHSTRRCAAAVQVCFLLLLLLPTVSSAQTEGDDARHLFDLGLQRVDTPDGDFLTTLFGYTHTFASDMSFTAGITLNHVTTYSNTDDSRREEQHVGFGDTMFIYSFVPGQKITAHPWVPKSIGFSVMLVVPTGNAEDSLGADQFVIAPQAGWFVHLSETVSLLPAVRYTASFGEGELALPVEQLSAELGLVWAHPKGWWIDYIGEINRDFEQDDWDYNDFFSVGKMFGSEFGVSLAYGILERTNPNALRDDFQWMVLFHWVPQSPGRS